MNLCSKTVEIKNTVASADFKMLMEIFSYLPTGVMTFEVKNIATKCFLKLDGSKDGVIFDTIFEGFIINGKKTFILKDMESNILLINWFAADNKSGTLKIYITTQGQLIDENWKL